MKISFDITRHPLFKAVSAILVLAIIGAILVTFFESDTNKQFEVLGDAIWWVLVTMTTVGYGDKVPLTPGGRIVGVFLMFFGVALLSIFTAIISSIFIARQIKEGRGLEQIKFKNHLIICGWNFNGEQILLSLQSNKNEIGNVVLINQLSEESIAEIINQFSALKIKFVRGDYTKEIILNRANTSFAKAAIILPDTDSGLSSASDERTILATLSIKAINSKIKVYAHIIKRENLSHIRKAKADDVLISDAYSGYLLAAHVLSPGIPQTVDQLFSDEGNFSFKRTDIPAQFVGKSYGELRDSIKNEKNNILIGLGNEMEGVNLSNILSDDYSFLDQFIKKKFEQAGRGFSNEKKVNVRINPPEDTVLNKKDFIILISDREEK